MPNILNADYSVAEFVEATPICGEDFCDLCGDCLYCYGADPCYRDDPEGGLHSWQVYADQATEFKATHGLPPPSAPA